MAEGNKRGFGDLDDDEEDIFSSKKVPLSTTSGAIFLLFFFLFKTISGFLCCIKCSSMGHQTVLPRSLPCLSVFLLFDIEELVMVCSKISKWEAIFVSRCWPCYNVLGWWGC